MNSIISFPGLIAQRPLVPRDASRMMVLDREAGLQGPGLSRFS